MKKFMILLACVLGCEGNTTQPSSKPEDAKKLGTLPAAWEENQVKAARDYFGRIYTVTGKVSTIKPGEVELYPISYDPSETAPKGPSETAPKGEGGVVVLTREDDGHKTSFLLVKCDFHLDDDKIIALKVGETTTLTGKLTGFCPSTLSGSAIFTFDKP